MPLVAAIDVGTASARAALFDAAGRLLSRADAPFETRGQDGQSEQSGTRIWQAAATALRASRAEAAAAPHHVTGLAFDATASLVLLDAAGRPVAASADGGDDWNVIPWHDHRAIAEAEACTATGHPLLARHGGSLSPEMPLPKLAWLRRHLPASWARTALALDLTDFLAFRATGNPARSHCTLACKWTWDPDAGWHQDFLAAIGLPDLVAHTGQPARAVPIATDLGPLTPEAAADLGLTPATRVAAGLIDAHAGALGTLGGLDPVRLETEAALVAGTSSAIMTFAPGPREIPGLWGPTPGGALPGLWLTEGGQSASGALLDHVLRFRGLDPTPATHARVIARVAELRRTDPDLAPDLHVIPDFHGRRSPNPDPRALGAIVGLPLDASFDALCALYWRSCVALALGLRSILDHLTAHGVPITTLHLAGGHTRNPLLMELYPDATGRRTVEPTTDPVLLGTAMTAAPAAGLHPTLAAATSAMRQTGTTREPDPARRYA